MSSGAVTEHCKRQQTRAGWQGRRARGNRGRRHRLVQKRQLGSASTTPKHPSVPGLLHPREGPSLGGTSLLHTHSTRRCGSAQRGEGGCAPRDAFPKKSHFAQGFSRARPTEPHASPQAPPDPWEGTSPPSPGRVRMWKGPCSHPAPPQGWQQGRHQERAPTAWAGSRGGLAAEPPRCLFDGMCRRERQFQEACFEALTSKKRKCLLNKR